MGFVEPLTEVSATLQRVVLVSLLLLASLHGQLPGDCPHSSSTLPLVPGSDQTPHSSSHQEKVSVAKQAVQLVAIVLTQHFGLLCCVSNTLWLTLCHFQYLRHTLVYLSLLALAVLVRPTAMILGLPLVIYHFCWRYRDLKTILQCYVAVRYNSICTA